MAETWNPFTEERDNAKPGVEHSLLAAASVDLSNCMMFFSVGTGVTSQFLIDVVYAKG